MKLIIEVEDDLEEAVNLVKWKRDRLLNSEGEVVRIGPLRGDVVFASRILDLMVEA